MGIKVDISKVELEIGMVIISNMNTVFGDRIEGIITDITKNYFIVDWYGYSQKYDNNGNYNFKVVMPLNKLEDKINESEDEND